LVGGQENHGVTELPELACPEVRTAAGLHNDDGGRQLGEEGQDLLPAQAGLAIELAGPGRHGELDDGLCDVEANQGIVHVDSSLYCFCGNDSGTVDADRVEGGVHCINAADGAGEVERRR
jgi:hypothetical protein